MNKFERRFGRYAIENLTVYLVAGQGIALVLTLIVPGLLSSMVLVPGAVLEGQWWRLLSFFFTPPSGNPIFAIFALYLLYFMGGALEQQWGSFRYNLYVLIGYLMTIAAAFVFPSGPATNVYITGSIFLAFAWLFPDFEILLFMILRVKVKWLALITWLFYAWGFIAGDWDARLLIGAALTNFFVFFGKDIGVRVRQRGRTVTRQASARAARDKPVHVCTICGVTDKTHPAMDFRYCTKCEPPVAYCEEHLRNHEHRA